MTTAAPSVSRERLLEQEVRNLRTEVERLRLALAEKKGIDVSTLQAPRHGPDPTAKHPAGGSPRVVFLANVVTRPNIEVGAAQILQARLGGDLTWLRWLDLRAMLWDLISSAAVWTLPDRGVRGWPAGLHVFAG